MTQTHEPLGTHWTQAELKPGMAEWVREELDGMPYMGVALADLAKRVGQEGSSVTVFQLPHNIFVRNAAEAMLSAAAGASEAIHDDGISELRPPYEVRVGEAPEDFSYEDPPHIKGNASSTDPIGYMRVEQQPDGTIASSLGCLDRASQTHYSLPL